MTVEPVLAAPAAPVDTFPPVADTVMLRFNPLRRTRLASSETVRILAEYQTCHAELIRLGEKCSKELHTLIGAATGPARRRLLQLRRDIHNGRLPDTDGLALPEVCTRWLELAHEAAVLEHELIRRSPESAVTEQEALVTLAGDEDFRRALALSAPEVLNAVKRYTRAFTQGTLSREERKSERGIVQYLARALTRTSPLSRFTAVGVLELSPDGRRLDAVRDVAATSFMSLDLPLLNYVLGGLASDGQEPWIQQAPSVVQEPESGRVTFVHTRDGVTRRLSAPGTDSVYALLRVTAMGPRRLSEAARDLAASLNTDQEAAVKLLAGGLSTGLLCRVPSGREMGGLLLGSALDEVPEGAPELTEIRTELRGLAAAAAEERLEGLRRIDELGTSLARRVSRPATLKVNEDFVIQPQSVSLREHAGQFADLANTVEFLSVFDRMHDVRALLTAAFVERFGRGGATSLLDCAELLVTKVYIRERVLNEATAADLGPADGSLQELLAVRRRALDELCVDLDGRAADGTVPAEVVWPSEMLAQLVADAPSRLRHGTLSYGVLVQTSGDRLVFNDAYAGHGMLAGRFLEARSQHGGDARNRLARTLQAWYGRDARAVEDTGLHRLNVNRHPQVLPDRIGPDDWSQLLLAHDEETDSLYIRNRAGERLNVLTLGAGMPELYPYPLRLATWLLTGGRLIRDIGAEWHRRSGWDPTGPTTSTPRLVAGDVVLNRRRWYLGGDAKDLIEPTGGCDAERLLAVARWRARHGVPDQVMLKSAVFGLTGYADRAEPAASAGGRWREKPQYVDCASALFVRALPRMLARRSSGWVEEALPAVEESPNAAEWVVALARPDGGRFSTEEWSA
ncbi:lantibiotic dehydratase [Kitasatospora sp. NPDC004669]|uniref:lantibiotic dehydratase n=1 Tax=Kitasatospora sp. NPDC004669 TaxID=3154555 RepID=UPI0033A099E7